MQNGKTMLTLDDIWNVLSEIPDPDIPVVSITDLGLVRKVDADEQKIIVSLTPSYSGCPAMKFFQQEIVTALKEKDPRPVELKTVFFPAWTTDWISDSAKEKMRKHGIAPPEKVPVASRTALFGETQHNVHCPWCNSENTKRTSQFGSTPCKAIWFCNACQQPFEYFKCY